MTDFQGKPVHIFIDPDLLNKNSNTGLSDIKKGFDDLLLQWKNAKRYDPALLQHVQISVLPFLPVMQANGNASEISLENLPPINLKMAMSILLGEYKAMMTTSPKEPQVYFILGRVPVTDEQLWVFFTKELKPYKPDLKLYFVVKSKDSKLEEDLRKFYGKHFKDVQVIPNFNDAIKHVTADLDQNIRYWFDHLKQPDRVANRVQPASAHLTKSNPSHAASHSNNPPTQVNPAPSAAKPLIPTPAVPLPAAPININNPVTPGLIPPDAAKTPSVSSTASTLPDPTSADEKLVDQQVPAPSNNPIEKLQVSTSGVEDTPTGLTHVMPVLDATDKTSLNEAKLSGEVIQQKSTATPAVPPVSSTEEVEKDLHKSMVLSQREPAKWQVKAPPENDPDPKKDQATDKKGGNDNWLIVGASQRGRIHAHEGTFREDDFRIETEGSSLLVAVADGAGSCKLSRVGAKLAVETAIQIMASQLKGNAPTKDYLTYVLSNALKGAWDRLQQEVENRKADGKVITFKDLSTTLLLLVYVPDHKIVGTAQVGDGLLFAEKENSELAVLGSPESGEYSGQTYFLTSWKKDAFESKVKIYLIESGINPRMFCIMTDGVADDVYPPIESLKGLVRPLHARLSSSEDPEEALLKLLQYERAASFDDRTLVVVYNREKLQVDQANKPEEPSGVNPGETPNKPAVS